MTATRKLFVNWDSKTLQVSDTNGGAFTLPYFNKYETVPFEVVIVELDRGGIGSTKWAKVDISPLSMSIALNDTYDDAAPLAYQNTFTKDESSNTFTGSLNLNTAALNLWIGSSDTKAAYFEIEIQEGSNVSKIYVTSVTVKNAVAQVGATVPSPVDEYYTKAQANAQLMQRVGASGDQLTFTSPDGAYQRIIGVGNGGEPIDQILPT